MAAATIDVKVDCRIDVDRKTAETCLKLVEAYLNSNRNIHIHIGRRKDGTKDLSFIERTEYESKSVPFIHITKKIQPLYNSQVRKKIILRCWKT